MGIDYSECKNFSEIPLCGLEDSGYIAETYYVSSMCTNHSITIILSGRYSSNTIQEKDLPLMASMLQEVVLLYDRFYLVYNAYAKSKANATICESNEDNFNLIKNYMHIYGLSLEDMLRLQTLARGINLSFDYKALEYYLKAY